MIRVLISTALILTITESGQAQKNRETTQRSEILQIDLPSPAVEEIGIFNIAAARSVLEIESAEENVDIVSVEVLTYKNESGLLKDSKSWIDKVNKAITENGYQVTNSIRDPSYSWLTTNNNCFLVYGNPVKKEAALYIGTVNKWPVRLNSATTMSNSYNPAHPQTNTNPTYIPSVSVNEKQTSSNIPIPELIGNWGTLTGAKVNWNDESTGYMLVSGVSKGYGLELKPDGSFLSTTVVTSGRPNYRVFVSTTGTWTATNKAILFYPRDRHYRKWENEIIMTNEHSVPENYTTYWRIQKNPVTGKNCLYIRYENTSDETELCNE